MSVSLFLFTPSPTFLNDNSRNLPSSFSTIEDSIVLKELGRLREISFRKVGEGVNKKRDIDKYDVYYQLIFIV